MNALDKLRAEFRLLGRDAYNNRYGRPGLKYYDLSYIAPHLYGMAHTSLPLMAIPIFESHDSNTFKFKDATVDLNKTYNKETGELE